MKLSVQKLTVLAMFSALAYMFMLITLFHIAFVPSIPFLKYDPKDIVITIAGFAYGPMSALIVILIVATLELITTSTTGIIGWLMNVIATASFCCTASWFYKKTRSKQSAIIGLVCGTVALVAVMSAWNLIITPMYMGVPRSVVAAMIIPGFIPFNALKGALNAGFTLVLYKPVIAMLSRARAGIDSSISQESALDASTIAVGVLFILSVIIAAVLLARA
ncbi:MAG: ECF transporter S component [Eubacteriaceae bacterium]|nr:ECF transporter S component [Eubacteriaceae bacterium]